VTARQSGSGACKSDPRDIRGRGRVLQEGAVHSRATRPLTPRERRRATIAGRQATSFGAPAAACRIFFLAAALRRANCLPELRLSELCLRAVRREGRGRSPGRRTTPSRGSVAAAVGRRLGVMTERYTITPSPRREDGLRRAPRCSRPSLCHRWALLLEATRRGAQCSAWRRSAAESVLFWSASLRIQVRSPSGSVFLFVRHSVWLGSSCSNT
jgi:hypothetical protein